MLLVKCANIISVHPGHVAEDIPYSRHWMGWRVALRISLCLLLMDWGPLCFRWLEAEHGSWRCISFRGNCALNSTKYLQPDKNYWILWLSWGQYLRQLIWDLSSIFFSKIPVQAYRIMLIYYKITDVKANWVGVTYYLSWHACYIFGCPVM